MFSHSNVRIVVSVRLKDFHFFSISLIWNCCRAPSHYLLSTPLSYFSITPYLSLVLFQFLISATLQLLHSQLLLPSHSLPCPLTLHSFFLLPSHSLPLPLPRPLTLHSFFLLPSHSPPLPPPLTLFSLSSSSSSHTPLLLLLFLLLSYSPPSAPLPLIFLPLSSSVSFSFPLASTLLRTLLIKYLRLLLSSAPSWLSISTFLVIMMFLFLLPSFFDSPLCWSNHSAGKEITETTWGRVTELNRKYFYNFLFLFFFFYFSTNNSFLIIKRFERHSDLSTFDDSYQELYTTFTEWGSG